MNPSAKDPTRKDPLDRSTRYASDVVRMIKVPVFHVNGEDPEAVIQGSKAPRGFGVRVTAAGAKSFVMNYRNRAHRERRFTIGQWPDWSVLKAVKTAKDLRQRIDRGEDPMDDRRKQDATHSRI